MSMRASTHGYLRSTKSMEHHFSNAEQDAVRCAFLPTSFVQIRKLPGKMRAGTLGQGGVVMSETLPRGFSRSDDRMLWTGNPPMSSPGLRQRSGFMGDLTKSQASSVGGTLPPRRFGVGPKMFSLFTYLPSEYDLEKQKRAVEKDRHAAKIVGPPCIKTGTPSIPEKQGTFTHFRYEIDPYESKDEYWAEVRNQEIRTHRPINFTPSGRFVAKDNLQKRKASQHELISRLIATLQSDWPETYRRCFIDKKGLIVCLFTDLEHDGAGRTELINYMHQLIKTHPVSDEYVLRKQSARWGRHSNGYIEFAIQPPWVMISPYEPYLRSHIEEAAKLQASNKTPVRSRSSSIAPPSRRMAVPPQTPNGTRIYSYLGGEGHLNM